METFGYSAQVWDAAKAEAKAVLIECARRQDTIAYSELVSKIVAIGLQAQAPRLDELLRVGGRVMKPGTVLIIVALFWPAAAAAQGPAAPQSSPAAQTPPAAPPRHPGYDKLQMFVGHWTIEGRENTLLEKCDWFDGRFHVVCHTESKRSDGTVARGISILGYLPEEDAYTYHGIGSRGRNETMRGTFEGSTFKAHGESRDGGKLVKSRVTATPAASGDFTFRSESSTDHGPWIDDGTIKYKRTR